MSLKHSERVLSEMPGDRLLEELVTYAALYLDDLQPKRDDRVALVRAIQARLAETGIARKYHGEACRFMLGEDRCACSSAHWSWPRKGLGALPTPERTTQDLIDRSSIGAGLRDIKERGIDAHVKDLFPHKRKRPR